MRKGEPLLIGRFESAISSSRLTLFDLLRWRSKPGNSEVTASDTIRVARLASERSSTANNTGERSVTYLAVWLYWNSYSEFEWEHLGRLHQSRYHQRKLLDYWT